MARKSLSEKRPHPLESSHPLPWRVNPPPSRTNHSHFGIKSAWMFSIPKGSQPPSLWGRRGRLLRIQPRVRCATRGLRTQLRRRLSDRFTNPTHLAESQSNRCRHHHGGSPIPNRRHQELGARRMNLNRRVMQRKPCVEGQSNRRRFDWRHQTHAEIGRQVVSSAITIESAIGFIELAIRRQVHQAGSGRRTDRARSNRNHVSTILRRSEKLRHRIEHKVGNRSAFPQRCALWRADFQIPMVQVADDVEQLGNKMNPVSVIVDYRLDDLENARQFARDIQIAAAERIERRMIQPLDFRWLNGWKQNGLES